MGIAQDRRRGMRLCMASGPSSLDWSLVQAFLAVADHGSLSAAARFLGASQPTVGRQIRAMEEQLGTELFTRSDKGLMLSEAGEALLDSARAMRDAAHEMELRAMGKGEELQGTVRLAASVVVATHHLPPIIAEIRQAEPQISIELVPSDESSNLHYREADIAVRMYRPTQLDLVTQYLGELTIGAFAARSYVARRGLPAELEQLLEHDVIGFDRAPHIVEGFRSAGFSVERTWFPVRTDHPVAYWQLVRAGVGIGFGQRSIAREDPELVELALDLKLPTLPFWLTTHQTLRHTPRVRRVWELLAKGLKKVVAADAPCDRAAAHAGSPGK